MKIVQNFKKVFDNELNNFLSSVCYTLSYLYAKSIGIEITLHTDNYGKDLLDHLKYKKVYTTLENVEKFDKRLFAYPKIYTIEREPLGVIHIDGDVFLKKESIKKLLDFKDYDVIVQSYEDKTKFGFGYDESIAEFKDVDFPLWASKSCECMYNTGLVGFNNEDIKRKFVYNYEKTARAYHKANVVKIQNACPDIIIEQKFLYDLTRHFNSKVKTLLDYDRLDEHAKEIGYTHVLGTSKLYNLDKMIHKIYELDKEVYNKLKDKWFNKYKFIWI